MMRILLFFLAIATFFSCKNDQEKQSVSKEIEGEVVAKVGNYKLYAENIKGLMKDDSKDSLIVVNEYIEQWVRRMAVLAEAESKVTTNLNIDQLVEDYRASLILHNYKVQIVDSLLGSNVSEEELEAFYKKHQKEFRTDETMIKGYIAKMKKGLKGTGRRFFKFWDTENMTGVNQMINDVTTFRYMGQNRWISIEDFMLNLPPVFSQRRIIRRGNIYKSYKGTEYFVKIFKVLPKNSPAPLSFVKDHVKKLYINERKKELLRQHEQDLYQKALEENKIDVYTK